MTRIFFLALCLISSPAFAFGSKRVQADPNTKSTLLDGDATAPAEGCGHQPVAGFLYCRVMEGDAANQSLWFIGPPAKCDGDACVFIKVFDRNGSVAWGDKIPKGQTRVEAPWWKLLGCPKADGCSFQLGFRGLWSFNEEVHWIDEAGHPMTSVSQGDLILRVHRRGYVPLQSVEHDPAFAWEWSEGGFVYRMTPGLRLFIGKE